MNTARIGFATADNASTYGFGTARSARAPQHDRRAGSSVAR